MKAGSGLLTFGTPSSGGVPAISTRHPGAGIQQRRTAGANLCRAGRPAGLCDSGAVCRQYESDPPQRRVLSPIAVRAVHRHGAVLIYDEVMTGFRGGAGRRKSCTASARTRPRWWRAAVCRLAFGGRADIMVCIAPLGGEWRARCRQSGGGGRWPDHALIQAEGFHARLGERTPPTGRWPGRRRPRSWRNVQHRQRGRHVRAVFHR